MRFYLIHKDGIISESGEPGFGYEINKEEMERNHPGESILEIIEENFNKIKESHEHFYIKNSKIFKKTAAEKIKIQDKKDEWIDNNTMVGLKRRVEKIEKQLINKI